jgi:hypothetical protein
MPDVKTMEDMAEETYRAIGRFIFAFSQAEYTIRYHLGGAIGIKDEYFTPVLEGYDVALLCTVTKQVYEKQRSPESYQLIKNAINRFLKINEERNPVVHGLWMPEDEGGMVRRVSRSLKEHIAPNQAEELERLADELNVLSGDFESAVHLLPDF